MSQNLTIEEQFQIEHFINQICHCHEISPELIVKIQSLMSKYMHRNRNDEFVFYHQYILTSIENSLNSVYQNARNMSDGDILVFYAKHWHNYRIMCDKLHIVCLSLNLQKIKINLSTMKGKYIERISSLSERLWEKILIKPLFSRVTQSCLNLINHHRNTQSFVDPKIIKDILDIYLDENFFKLIQQDRNNRNITDSYIDCFEKQYLQQAQEFYSHRKNHLGTNETIEYLISILNYLCNELNFAKCYLPKDKSTLKDLNDTLEDLFFSGNIFHNIWNDLELLIENQNHCQIANFYKSIIQVPRIKTIVVELIEREFYQKGLKAFKLIHRNAMDDPKLYLDTMIDIRMKLSKFVEDDINFQLGLQTILDTVCSRLMRTNVLNPIDKCKSKLGEIIAIISIFRTIKKVNLKEKFEQIMIFTDYIDDKNLFGILYEKRLMKRLVEHLSISIDLELFLITNLLGICKDKMITKFRRMCQDITCSQRLRNYHQGNYPIYENFSITILNSLIWPILSMNEIILPNELNSSYDHFQKCYKNYTKFQRLILLPQYSYGELEVCFKSLKYIFEVSLYQMIVLLLFNQTSILTIEQIQNQTNIRNDILQEVIASLLKHNLIICDQRNNLNDMNYSIRLINDFKSSTMNVKLKVPLELTEVKKNDEQKYGIKLLIIQIMKERKSLLTKLLIGEVMEKINQSNEISIQKCINQLIEQDYLKKDFNQQSDLLHYLP
ncbi:hypothetical protein I4U23_011616 [Adineta vaga]|nr:hypothetical protein I4U23_011616 [Adineta vaga]